MQDGVHEPLAAPIPSSNIANRRTVLLLAVGGAAGLTLGVLLTIGAYSAYVVFTQTLPSTVESIQVFNELNEMRQQINQLNEEKKILAKGTEDAMRKALSAVASTAPSRDGQATEAVPPAKVRARKAPGVDPFADIDAEIQDLERTQKTLNTILDLFTRNPKERAKDSREAKRE
jgi:hypothetical protein